MTLKSSVKMECKRDHFYFVVKVYFLLLFQSIEIDIIDKLIEPHKIKLYFYKTCVCSSIS